MKKMYTKPTIEKVEFCYNEQIAASGNPANNCHWVNLMSHAARGCYSQPSGDGYMTND